MKIQKKILHLLCSSPYPKPFSKQNSSQKSSAVNIVNNVVKYVSGNSPSDFCKYFQTQSYLGKQYFQPVNNPSPLHNIIVNIQKLHSNSPVKYKSFGEGFHFSNNQYSNAKK